MLIPITTTRDLSSLSEINDYLKNDRRRLATNSEISSQDFQRTTVPNWTKKIPGCVALFTSLVVTDTADEQSPLRKNIIPRANTEPVLSTFLPGIAAPFSFESYDGVLPAGTVVWTAHLLPIAA